MHKHHIVFRSQGGLDFPLNFKYLSYEDHEGPNGPHRSRITDLKYKIELQTELNSIFQANKEYTQEQISDELGLTKKYIAKNFKRVANNCGLYRGDDIVRNLWEDVYMSDDKIIKCTGLLQRVLDTKSKDEAAIRKYRDAALEAGTSEDAVNFILEEAGKLA